MKSIVFPEGNDERIIKAVNILSGKECTCIVIGIKDKISKLVSNSVKVIDNSELKGEDRNEYGVKLVLKGKADAMISGADSKTSEVLRPALKLLKKEGVKASGLFHMKKEKKEILIADCAVNININSQTLKDIIIESSKTASIFNIIPRIAVLSYSTKGSSKGESVNIVKEGTELAIKENPNLIIEGEVQADVAVSKIVSEKKCPSCTIKGDANILIMPDLNCGNISHKLLEHIGGFKCTGPIIQGLLKPVNDLSRGCTVEQIIEVTKITVKQIKIQSK